MLLKHASVAAATGWFLVSSLAIADSEAGEGNGKVNTHPRLVQLTGPQLDLAIRGKQLRRADAGQKSPDTVEMFEPNGSWIITGTRVPISGTFTVKSDKLCVIRSGNTVYCRTIYRDVHGKYYALDQAATLPSRGGIYAVEIVLTPQS